MWKMNRKDLNQLFVSTLDLWVSYDSFLCLLPHSGSKERKDGIPDNILGLPLHLLADEEGRFSLIFDLKFPRNII